MVEIKKKKFKYFNIYFIIKIYNFINWKSFDTNLLLSDTVQRILITFIITELLTYWMAILLIKQIVILLSNYREILYLYSFSYKKERII